MKVDVCPNRFPTRAGVRRIAIVAEAPGTSELSFVTCSACHHSFASEYTDQRGTRQSWSRCERCGSVNLVATPTPLVGPSGRLLNKLLDEAGIRREECFVGNVCQRQPPRNEIARFKWDGPEIQEGLARLRADLATFQPQFVLALGGTALRALLGKGNIDDRRGYTFDTEFVTRCCPVCQGGKNIDDVTQGCYGCGCTGRLRVKCLATYHPARLLRESGLTGIARFDFAKAAREARTDGVTLPLRAIEIDLPLSEILARLHLIKANHTRIAVDVEGGVNGIACFGIATSPTDAFVIPFITVSGESVWSEEDETTLWEALRDVLEDPLVPKIIMNALYEWFVVAWTMGVVIRGVTDDIMLKHFELYCEFEKSLEFQASLYLDNQSYWKLTHRNVQGRYVPYRDGKPVTSAEWYTYNGTDCCVTYACDLAQDRLLQPRQRDHYQSNMRMLTRVLYQMLRGLPYDYEEAQKHKASVEKRIYALQDRINREAVSGGKRPELASFLAACEPATQPSELPQADKHVVGLECHGTGLASSAGRLLPFLTDAFCQARRTEKVEVEETLWQPMRWSPGKPRRVAKVVASAEGGVETPAQGSVASTGRWVKAGKRLIRLPEDCGETGTGEEAPGDVTWSWFKPITKRVTRSVTVPILSLTDVRRFAKDSVKAECRRACALVNSIINRQATPARRGELATLLRLSVKIRASGRDKDEEDETTGDLVRGDERDANWFLYEHCGLPRQYVKERNRLTDRLASDAESVIKAWIASSKTEKGRDRRALWFATLKSMLTEVAHLEARADDDGRIRSSINLVGSKTHRIANRRSPTGTSNLNLQTITKSHRRFYRADDGYFMCQRDLSGADGWTVAAYCDMLGDSNMLEDYRAKLKPAQIGVLMWQRGPQVNSLSRAELKPLCEPITEESTQWEYFAFKRVQHMSSYMGGVRTMSNQILKDSVKKGGKPVFVNEKTCEQIQQRCFFMRYHGIPKWHAWMAKTLKEEGQLTASNGFTRRFYAIKTDRETIGDALSHLPQVYTTYATLLALARLWDDPSNRRPDGSLIIEPLHTVHDSLITQWPREVTEWARERMSAWFDNPIDIARTRLVIPASGSYGVSWGEQDFKL